MCLSLLGTFNAGDASEKWDPNRSSLFQVLVSIQSQILTEDPIVNEPGYEGKPKRELDLASAEYNAKLRLATMRHAMTGQLLKPPAGCEDAVVAHFTHCRQRVLCQCRQWTLEAPAELRPKMEAALTQLHAALPPAPELSIEPTPEGSSEAAAADDDEDGLYD